MKTKRVITPYMLNRRYFYAYGGDLLGKHEDGNPLYAYTKEEWGIGGSFRGGNYTTRNVWFLLIISILMVPASLFGLFGIAIGIIGLNFWVSLFCLPFTLLFGAGVITGFHTCAEEFKARRYRWIVGIPKPGMSVDDDHAYTWFEQRPERGIALTEENFPDATIFHRYKEVE